MKLQDLKQIIRSGDVRGVETALEAQPELLHVHDLEDQHWEERTALHCAVRYGHLEIVKLLVDRGAEVYSHPHASYPAIFIANQFRYFPDRPDGQPIIDYFLNDVPEKAAGTMGLGATIHIAARLGFTEVVRKHLALDPLAVHQRGWLGDTPLHWACHNGHVEIVRMLLDAGADIEADEINCYGGKPLHWASEHEPQVVQLLLERGAQVDSRNVRTESDLCGVTPLLMNALQRDDCAEVTELLIAAGADVQAVYRGQKPLDVARQKGNLRITAVLEKQTDSTTRRVTRLPPLPPRPKEAHKGTFGSVLVIAGSRGMAGAACLAGRGALHGGAGLVTVATPRSVAEVVAGAHHSYMTLYLDEDDDGRLVSHNQPRLEKVLERQSAVALGPGLGQGDETRRLVQALYGHCDLPLVLDADGLNAFDGEAQRLSRQPSQAPRILTPHPGEFSRLTGLTSGEIQSRREPAAIQFARQHRVVLLLKGAATVITDGEQLAINPTGDSGLATGGSGDVLTGLIAALMAQGMEPFQAAQLGAHVHGLAGEAASEQRTGRFTTSMDLADHLADAWKVLESGSQ